MKEPFLGAVMAQWILEVHVFLNCIVTCSQPLSNHPEIVVPTNTTHIHKQKLSFEMFILLLEKQTFLKLWVQIIYMEPFPFLILGK